MATYERTSYRYGADIEGATPLILYCNRENGDFAVGSAIDKDITIKNISSEAEAILTVFMERERFGISDTEAFLILDTPKNDAAIEARESIGRKPDKETYEARSSAFAIEKRPNADLKTEYANILVEFTGTNQKAAEKIYDRVVSGEPFEDAFTAETHHGMDYYQKEILLDKIKSDANPDKIDVFNCVEQKCVDAIEAGDIEAEIEKKVDRFKSFEDQYSDIEDMLGKKDDEFVNSTGGASAELVGESKEESKGDENLIEKDTDHDQAEDDYSDSDKAE